jgi:steroid delta-isomerase-like uncharacterized protein
MSEKTITNSSQANMDLIRAWVDAVNRDDIEEELACWQPDGEFYIVPTATTYKGIAAIRQAGKQSAAAIGGQPIQGRKQITHLDAGEDWACVEYDTQATITGPIAIQNVTVIPEGVNQTVVSKACVVFQMKNGKIDRAREYFDSFSMAQQLGLDRAALAKMYSSLGSADISSKRVETTRTALETVRLFFDAWNKKDIDGLMALLDSKVSGRNPLSGQERIITKEAFRTVLRRNMKSFPDLHMRVDRAVADGEIVAVEEFETATLTSANQSYEMPVACFFRVNADGLIVEIHNYWDTKTYFQQLATDPEALSRMLDGSSSD